LQGEFDAAAGPERRAAAFVEGKVVDRASLAKGNGFEAISSMKL